MLDALEANLGKNGLNAVFNLAGIPQFIEEYPPDNLDRGFDFAYTSVIFQALEDIYGPRGGRGLALRAGRMAFPVLLRDYGPLVDAERIPTASTSIQIRVKYGLDALAGLFNRMSDQQSSVQETGEAFIYSVQRCPFCWGRHGVDKPVCSPITGLLIEGTKWASGGLNFQVAETGCMAMGEPSCDFAIQKEPIS